MKPSPFLSQPNVVLKTMHSETAYASNWGVLPTNQKTRKKNTFRDLSLLHPQISTTDQNYCFPPSVT